MKIIIFKKISFLLFFFFIFFRILNFKIYYLNISSNSLLKNKKIIYLLSKLNLVWFNYIDFDLNSVVIKQFKITKDFTDNFSNEISNKFWGKDLEKNFINKNYFNACLNQNIWVSTTESIELLCVADFLKKKYNLKVYIFSSNNIIFRKINHSYYNFRNLNFFPKLYILEIINYLVIIVFNKFLGSISLKSKKQGFENKIKKNINPLNQYKIGFVPHQGVNYNNLFIKDFYYDPNKKSNFYPTKIIHIELQNKNYLIQSKNFYLKNKINNIIINDVISYRKILLKFIFFIIKTTLINVKIFKYDSEIFYYYLKTIYFIFKYEEIISKFSSLKLLLVGHDVLFPLELSVVCKKKNIKTIAIQDRIVSSYWTKLLIFDYYFVSSSIAKKLIKSRMFPDLINKLVNIHPIKVEKFTRLKNNIIRKDIKCLILDRHSDVDWYLGHRTANNNWKINKEFYELILKLSRQFPNIDFDIKSKDYEWLKINFFREIISKFNKQKNVNILNNKSALNHKLLLKKYDFIFAFHTSLSDELLFLGKPVILLNENGYPGDIFPFSKTLLADSYDEICKKIYLIIKNDKGYNLKLNKIKNKIFFNKKFLSFSNQINNIFSKL